MTDKTVAEAFKEFYAMASELSLELARRHDPANGLDLTDAVLISLEHQRGIYSDYLERISPVPTLPEGQ